MKILVNVLLRVTPVGVGESAKSTKTGKQVKDTVQECTGHEQGHRGSYSLKFWMQGLNLPALGQFREGQQDSVEVRQVVEHRRLKEVRLANHKVVVDHV